MDKPIASQEVILSDGTRIDVEVPDGYVPVCVKKNGSSGDVRYRIQFVEDLTGSSGGSDRTVKHVDEPELVFYGMDSFGVKDSLVFLDDLYKQVRDALGPVLLSVGEPITCRNRSPDPLRKVSNLNLCFWYDSDEEVQVRYGMSLGDAFVGALRLCPNVMCVKMNLPVRRGVVSEKS